ncbi:glycerol-3-phosphate dehydrogenase [Plasmodium falciparum IGH-CR14]|uniref:Glycerol-3-phosphate dehydrogenase [NAD(+)] n=1 Tax=Plasmodium falciparum IGH-CR14 TaxID=580059 RepID=A0A0L1I5Y7_PLAFA|nr:glycerol-3-phosphate dehydrogenase [Plasmodium falciparum IGH-CR14]
MYRNLFDKLKDGPLKISILGSGNWASAISKVVGTNAKNNYLFENEVRMWIRDEFVNGERMVDIINNKHENTKYLKGVPLPHNIVAHSDLASVINDADLLIFIVPCQYLESVLALIKESESIKIASHAKAISLTKGFIDVAMENFSEATIGGNDKDSLVIWQRVFDLPYFKINCVNETIEVEICGALKNIITLACGFCDGLNLPTNSKSAIIRNGINEMILFGKVFFQKFNENILLESCGFADIITSFLAGRNAKCSAEFIKSTPKKTWEELENEILKGQKLQGTVTLKYVYHMIKEKNMTNEFPLFTVLHKISFENEDPSSLLKTFMNNKINQLSL